MQEVHENLIKITSLEVAGKLPDPFTFDDGHRMTSPAEWPARRKEIYKTAVELQYGTQPPAPEFVEPELLYKNDGTANYLIHTGTRENPVTYTMRVFFPTNGAKAPYPTVVDGDLCFNYCFDTAYRAPMLDNGILYVAFNRTEIAHDVPDEPREQNGALYRTYPGYTFGALGAWAWGYARTLDALLSLGLTDPSCVAYTGHSRGGKTAMLAGILDERATIVNPNETNAGSCSCYRIKMSALTEDGEDKISETGLALCRQFPYWVGPDLMRYMEAPETLPFDAHYVKAMVAPRVLLVGEAASDIWTNPVGTWETTLAAREVFDYLGVKENLYWYFRRGYHFHKPEDIEALVGVMMHEMKGTPIPSGFFKTPFPPQELIFDWRKPE